MQRYTLWVLALVMGFVVIVGSVPSGHTPIASRWNYNEHLFPIFRDRCGSCHIEGGVGPMSLVNYQEAYPWTQSIREEILGLRMPPWQAEDGFGNFKNGHALAASEMDMILEWSSGGYPQGPRDKTPAAPEVSMDWSLGEPGAVLEMGDPYTLAADTSDLVRYFVLPTVVGEDRWITGVDFQPGARAVVRGAAVFIDTTGVVRLLDEADPDQGFTELDGQDFPTAPPVAVWIPGQAPVVTPGMGYLLPTSADVVLRLYYKKTWITEGQEFSDQSRVGLYFADGTASAIESLLVTSPASVSGRQVTFTHEIAEDVSLLALLPEIDIESSEMKIEAITPDGSRIPMLWLREPDAGWPTRFWFDNPVSLPQGSQLEITTILDPGATRSAKSSLLGGHTSAPIRFAVDYVSGAIAAN